jgi:transposase
MRFCTASAIPSRWRSCVTGASGARAKRSPAHLFTLKQSLDGYRYYQRLIAELDQEICDRLQQLPGVEGPPAELPARTKHTAYQRYANDPAFDLRGELYRIAGVDLTDIPGISAATAQVILTEIGPDLRRFRNASAFASWLGLCPEQKISGGKVLSCHTRKVKNRAALALRMGAHAQSRAKGYFGEFFRRVRAKLGTPQAITATAHKIARVLYHILSTKQPYTESLFHRLDEHAQQRAELRLRRQASQLGFQLIPSPNPGLEGVVP